MSRGIETTQVEIEAAIHGEEIILLRDTEPIDNLAPVGWNDGDLRYGSA